MEKIRCEVCGKTSSRISIVCAECTAKAMSKSSADTEKAIEIIKEIDSALEILDITAATDTNIGEVMRKLNKVKETIE